jgi:hypothetical protein
MARKLFNLIWVTLRETEEKFVGALQIGFTITSVKETTPGVILYPSLMTPLVHMKSKEEWVELLIATEKTLTPDMVNRQLRISSGLDAAKSYDPAPLFGGAGDKIVVEKAAGLTAQLETHTKFVGLLHKKFISALEDKGLTKVWKVKVHASCLRDSTGTQRWSKTEAKFIEYTTAAAEPKIRRYVRNDAIVGQETHDELIRAMLERRFGSDRKTGENPIPGMCRYAFGLRGGAVDMGKANPNEPVQSYHPVVVMSDVDEFTYANIGHVSDIHINSRWQLLGKSTARVIEWGDGQHEDESPRIGDLLSETNRSFYDVLHRMCGSDAHAVVVGGDLVDHIRNAYNAATIVHKYNSVHQIWDTMDLENYTQTTYPKGVDLLAFYTMIVDALRSHQKPFFAITGNHDCYEDAFGISPRVFSNRANGGIPADLNLTFYEALLSFGPSSGMLINLSSSFKAEWFEWFHLVLTPWNDWWVKLPKQSIVGLGWGDKEDMLLEFAGEQGMGHLPRSDEGVSGKQLALVQRAVGERTTRKVVLTSHFTFLSYNETVPMFPGGAAGSPGTFNSKTTSWGLDAFSRFEMGTFETNRQAMFTMLGQRQIQLVLTGHSHRRGLHLLGAPAGATIPARLYDTDPDKGLDLSPLPPGATSAEPAIIVSDSAGPYPRYNRDGEFREWGSDRPGGTLVKFDPGSGSIAHVRTIQARGRPKARAIVSLDYLDITQNLVFKNNHMLVSVAKIEWDAGVGVPPGSMVYTFLPHFLDEITDTRKIHIRRLVFAAQKKGPGGREWLRIDVPPLPLNKGYFIPPNQTADFRCWLQAIGEPTRYVSMQLGTSDPFLAERYDWGSYWNIEVEAVRQFKTIPGGPGQPKGLGVEYRLQRPTRSLEAKLKNSTWREVPPYDWRVGNDPKYAP